MPTLDWDGYRSSERERLILTNLGREKEYHYSMVNSIALREDFI
jgi:hypothetical protein